MSDGKQTMEDVIFFEISMSRNNLKSNKLASALRKEGFIHRDEIRLPSVDELARLMYAHTLEFHGSIPKKNMRKAKIVHDQLTKLNKINEK